MSSKPTLIYFAARGRAELIRLTAAEAGLEWDEVPFEPAMKGTARLPFDAVPVWEEADGFRLAQSMAIAQHIARGHGLLGKTSRETAQIEQALYAAFDDARQELRKLVIAEPSQRAALRAELAEKTLPRWFGYLDRILAANKDGTGFVVGESISIADLAYYYLCEYATDLGFGETLAKYPRLFGHMRRIGNRDRLRAYINGTKRHPFQPPPSP
jgi:glutathione S-transferase